MRTKRAKAKSRGAQDLAHSGWVGFVSVYFHSFQFCRLENRGSEKVGDLPDVAQLVCSMGTFGISASLPAKIAALP